MKDRLRILVAACAMLAIVPAQAQNYPEKPITIVVPFGPGSGTDVITRIIAQPLGAALNQNIVVETKPGANGAIAATYVAHAAPDGYTLFMSTNSPHSAAPTLNKSINYDPIKDFTGISRVGSFTMTIAVGGKLPFKTIADLVAHAKANPGKLSYGTGNTAGILTAAAFKKWAGVDMVHVPYKTVPPAITDALGGQIAVVLTDVGPGIPHFTSGALRPLATSRLQRSALLPNVPTLHELGATGLEVDAWAGLFAPTGTPPEIVKRLNAEVVKILADPKVKEQIAKTGFDTISSTPAELNDFSKAQLVKWTKMIKDAGIQAE
jgi:tripartite-type tricarboxylate transporter receptor subunit TctC